MSDKEIHVPNIGEFKNVEVIEVLVSSGQSVRKNDPLITIESDKSSVEIPASIDGNVKSVDGARRRCIQRCYKRLRERPAMDGSSRSFERNVNSMLPRKCHFAECCHQRL
jgi:hypothetical protein